MCRVGGGAESRIACRLEGRVICRVGGGAEACLRGRAQLHPYSTPRRNGAGRHFARLGGDQDRQLLPSHSPEDQIVPPHARQNDIRPWRSTNSHGSISDCAKQKKKGQKLSWTGHQVISYLSC